MEDEVDIVKPRTNRSKKSNENLVYKIVLSVIVLLVVIGVSFYAGEAYQKGHTPKTVANTSSNSRLSGGFARFSNRTIGKVTAISSTSITVQADFGSSSTKTYAITSTTVVTDQGQTSTVSAIAVGDTVVVMPSTSDTSDAATIDLNPSFGGFGNSTSGSASTSGSSTTGSNGFGSNTTGSNTTGSNTTLN